ncbi:PhzF family phenazine biosynthesis protein [Ideonella sp.]|uniref:PhzF family phenazine biosynthesis protein n=1 Tax=Ideonella sp. TaxID=1929293 RepID=UPI003BB55CC5
MSPPGRPKGEFRSAQHEGKPMSSPQLRRYTQLDVFTTQALLGNPLAVVHDADGLSDAQMAAFARWTQLSETTFLLQPTDPAADYRVRIFTPQRELPFAGHPTLGSCRAWLAGGGLARKPGEVVQQCAAGLIRIRRDGARLAFAAPPCIRTGPLAAEVLQQICTALSLPAEAILDHQWVDNGPGWCAVRLASADAVRAVQVDWRALAGLKLGLVGAHPEGAEAQWEVRALIGEGSGYEDPVTGSLNASLAQWLIQQGTAQPRYVAAQGHCLQRAGRIHVQREGDTVWIGGDVTACISGTVNL